MMNLLKNHLLQVLPQLGEQADKIVTHFRLQQVKAGEVVVQEKQFCPNVYFVCSGCLHLYFDDNGHANTIHFALENWWLTDYKAFLSGGSSDFSVAAIEDSVLAVINLANYDRVLIEYPLLAVYFNKIHSRAYGASLVKQKSILSHSRWDFYHYFTHHYPQFVRRIPDDILASYMGISTRELLDFRSR